MLRVYNRNDLLIFFLALLFGILALSATPVYAGAPWPPEPFSPANGSTSPSNPPTLCAQSKGDPEGEPVQIRFEVNGGGEGDHISPWLNVTNADGTVCWRDTGIWSAQSHAWQVRAQDSGNNQSGASAQWGINILAQSTPVPTCTIDMLTVNPPPPQVGGVSVTVSASAICTDGVKSLRFKANGNEIGTVNAGSGTVTWNTTGYPLTDNAVTVEAADSVKGYIQSRSQSYTLTAAPPPTAAPVNHSGGADIGGYCRSQGYDDLKVDPSNAYSWSCRRKSNGQTAAIDMNALCKWEFNGQLPYPGLSNPNDANTWSCNSQPINVPSRTTTGTTSTSPTQPPPSPNPTSVPQSPTILTASASWFKVRTEHIACAVFAVPNSIYSRNPIYATWFQSADGVRIYAGFYGIGADPQSQLDLENQFGVKTPSGTHLYATCISGGYFFTNPTALQYGTQMRDKKYWIMSALPR